VDGNLLADGISVSDDQSSDFGVGTHAEYLRSAADGAIGEKVIVPSDGDGL
jgi:hypothetical protein